MGRPMKASSACSIALVSAASESLVPNTAFPLCTYVCRSVHPIFVSMARSSAIGRLFFVPTFTPRSRSA